jgi:hypothetical protein
VAKRTPPPKHSRTDVMVLFQKFLSPPKSDVSIKEPSFSGKKPSSKETPPRRDRAIILTVIRSSTILIVLFDLEIKQQQKNMLQDITIKKFKNKNA